MHLRRLRLRSGCLHLQMYVPPAPSFVSVLTDDVQKLSYPSTTVTTYLATSLPSIHRLSLARNDLNGHILRYERL
jgi:hypothetical protein